jgi:hypothetical protein
MAPENLAVRLSYWRFYERNFTSAFCTFSTSSLVPLQRFNSLTIQPFNVREAMTRPRFLPLGYSSLLGQCLRLVSYAT